MVRPHEWPIVQDGFVEGKTFHVRPFPADEINPPVLCNLQAKIVVIGCGVMLVDDEAIAGGGWRLAASRLWAPQGDATDASIKTAVAAVIVMDFSPDTCLYFPLCDSKSLTVEFGAPHFSQETREMGHPA
jgi:hypothetical protein